MKVAVCWEKRDWGGEKPSWRVGVPILNNSGRSKLLSTSIRTMSNRQTKKLNLVFGGWNL